MKILQLISSLHGGGAEKFCIDLSNELSKENEVVICSMFDIEENMFMAKKISKNIKVITLGKKVGFDIKIFFKIFKIVKDEKPDIIHTHMRVLFYSILVVLSKKYKIFHTIHSIATKETSKMNQKLYNIFFNYCNVKPVAISQEVHKSIQSRYGKKHNILIVNGTKHCITTDQLEETKQEILKLKITNDTKIFITIGRLVKEKNQIMMINAINEVINMGNDLILLIIGIDPLENEPTKKELEKYKTDRIHLLGAKENISDYLFCSDAFCLSSLYEGLPITLLEAMSLGIIPICTPAGGIVNVIDSEIGFISSNFSKEEYIKQINAFLSLSDDQLKHMQNKLSQEFSLKYDIITTSKNYIQEYLKC